ncbi:hypothetical protein V8E51_000273 [Hyaloscypha variabilis]
MPFHLQPQKRKAAREAKKEAQSAKKKAKEEEETILNAIRTRCEALKGLSREYECKNKDEHYLVMIQFPDYQETQNAYYWLLWVSADLQHSYQMKPAHRREYLIKETNKEEGGMDKWNDIDKRVKPGERKKIVNDLFQEMMRALKPAGGKK